MHLHALPSALAVLSLVTFTSAKVPQLDGWKRIWYDDFTSKGKALPKSSNWKIDTGHSYPGGPANWGTGEVQRYTASTKNLYTDNGMLHIKPVLSNSGEWTSARIETHKADFMAKPGRKMKIQAHIALPDVTQANGLGYWPAFWTMGHAFRGNYNNWPKVGELDIAENINGLNSIVSGLHCGTNPGGPCNEPVGLTEREACPKGNCNGEFHLFSVVVDRSATPERVRFFTDGHLRREVTSDDLGAATWNQTLHQGHFILLNCAVGGIYPDSTAGVTTPTEGTLSGKAMRVQYVAVYEQ